jgi:hypothetical protein
VCVCLFWAVRRFCDEGGVSSSRRLRLKLPTSPGLPGPYGRLAAGSVTRLKQLLVLLLAQTCFIPCQNATNAARPCNTSSAACQVRLSSKQAFSLSLWSCLPVLKLKGSCNECGRRSGHLHVRTANEQRHSNQPPTLIRRVLIGCRNQMASISADLACAAPR